MAKQRDWSGFEIAVIGLAGRFPGARDVQALWRNLEQGTESIRFLALDELLRHGRDEKTVRADSFVPAHGVLDDFDRFDAEFFGFRPAEAEALDPQHRVFLEVAWEALEDAGYDPARYRGLIGVFAGSSADHYLYDNVRRNAAVMGRVGAFQAGYSNLMDHLATRVSYKLNLLGPSFAIQSACSTSLVAAHVACQQLLTGACDIALAGGVSLTLPSEWGYQYQDGMIHSPDGHCRAFDADAQGCLKGDGAGVVVLKRLADALADGDHIEAVILGSAANNDGSDKVGYTAPGLDGQVRVIEAAHAVAGIEAGSIGYVEAHGTGTRLGDPIEIAALSKVFRRTTQQRQFCGIGSIKTNFGHLDAAAGVAGLIKAVLALRQRVLPPNLHFRRPNANIDFAASPFYVVDRALPWSAGELPRRAAVSSFGIGGTNAHMVLEEAPLDPPPVEPASPQILVLSARSQRSLDEGTERLAAHLAAHPDVRLCDAAYTLQLGRKAFARRRAVVCTTPEEAIAALRDPGARIDATLREEAPRLVFLFPGQGAQYVGMGEGLYEGEPTFRRHVDACAAILEPLLGFDIRRVLYPGAGHDRAALAERLKQTEVAQPALFVVEYALAQWLIERGLEPAAMIGHSLGEYVAACLAGVFALEDALALVAARSALMQAQPAGEMAAVPLPAAALEPLLGDTLSLAAENAPSLCVVSGPRDALDALCTRLGADHGVECRRLNTSHAFHSRMMQPAVAPFLDRLGAIPRRAPQRRSVSTVTGTWFGEDDASDPQYWARNIRDTVRFSRAVRTAAELGAVVFVEVGPGTTLTSLARLQKELPHERSTVAMLRHPGETGDDRVHAHAALARLWAAGLDVRWEALHREQPRRRVALPTYAFQRERYWVDPVVEARGDVEATARAAPPDWYYLPSWTRSGLPVAPRPEPGGWLIVARTAGDAELVARQLDARQAVAVWALDPDESGRATNAAASESPPLDERIEELARSGRLPRHIVHLGGLRAGADGGFHALLRLCRGVAAGGSTDPLSLTIVSEGACSVLGTEEILAERALPMGLAQVLPTELPNVRCRVVDIDTSDPRWPLHVVRESASDSADAVVAYRSGQRWRRTLEPLRLEEGADPPARLRPGGVYLVTGGLGGMGLELAGYLARSVAAKLVLASRSALPEREHWTAWLAEHGSDDPVSRTIERIREMESQGAAVMVARVDVSDADAVAQLCGRIHRTFGPVNGVIHAAGIPGGGVIALQDAERAEQVFAAKVRGTRNLYECLRGDGLDFMVLCSSLTSVIPRAGRAEYTAANLFLDAFAHGVRDTRVLAINWDNWTETGMARAAAQDAPIEGLSTAEGIRAFACALAQGGPQVLVSTRDLLASLESAHRPAAAPSAALPVEAAPEESTLHARPDVSTAYEAPRNAVEATLVSIWKDLLGLAQVGIRDNFFDLGGDSVVSIQLAARARKAGLSITAKQVFESGTIAELAEAAGAPRAMSAPQRAVAEAPSGRLPLSPMQHWFFELPIRQRNHWNLAALFETPPPMEMSALRVAVTEVLRQHDAFALRFPDPAGGWQTMAAAPAPAVEVVDLAATPDHEIEAALDRLEASMQTTLDLEHGPLVRAACVTLGRERQGRLLIVAHHLVADIIALRALAEDVGDAYARQRRGEPAVAPATGTPFRIWVERLEAFARSAEVAAELPYWSAQAAQPAVLLPRDHPDGRNTVASCGSVAVELDAETTKVLTARQGTDRGSSMPGVLLGALARTIAEWSGAAHAWIDVEGHGRDAFADDIDVARTMGWFTTLHPMALARGADAGNAVALASRQIQAVPRRGFGYGLLRFLHPDPAVRAQMAQAPRPEIVFLYQGQLTGSGTQPEGLRLVRMGGDRCRAADELRSHVLEIDARIEAGVLRVDWVFSRNLHRRETIEGVARRFERSLRELAMARLSPAAPAGEDVRAAASAEAPRRTARLSFAQERIWFLQQLAPASTLYNKQAVLKLTGDLDVDALVAALSALTERHAALRTRIAVDDGVPMQVIEPPRRFELPVTQLDHVSTDGEAELAALWQARVGEPFDLEAAAPFRATLVQRGPREHWLEMTFHHIVTDAWSAQVLVRELGALYSATCRGRAAALAPLPLTFADFAERQRASFTAAALAPALDYWTRALAGLAPLELPTDRPRPPVQRFEGKRVAVRWPAALTAALRGLARSHEASLFMVLLAIFKVLLQRYSLQDDVAVGIPAADRPEVDTENLIGPLVNNLVMRTDLSGDPSFAQLLARVRDTVLAANEHRELPFEQLVEALHPERDRSRSPIFQVMFAFMNVPEAPGTWEDLDVTVIEPDHGAAEFDLSLYCYDPAPQGELCGWIEYSTALFDAATIERMAEHLQRVATEFVAAPDRPIAAVALMGDAERQRMLFDWNRTATAYPRDAGMHGLFEQQVDRDPARLAVRFDDGEALTYGELERRANQVAHHLRALGVTRDARVALCVDRSSAMLVGMLGILKAGGAYVPLDPSYPRDRLAYMLADCGAAILLTQAQFRDVGTGSAVTSVCLDSDWPDIAARPGTRIGGTHDPAALAYVIYTSGSTGKPKGVQIEHRAVANFLNAMRVRPGMGAGDRLLAVTTMSFDIHVLELFVPLAVGGSVVVASRETAADPVALMERLATGEITVMQATPSTWRMLVDAGWTGREGLKILCGGEALPSDLARMLLDRCASLWNMYGPTEATVWACVDRIVDPDAPITIGRPFDNVRCYVLDARGLPLPVGVPGELYIGGDCLARGYLDRPELTRERFLPDPFLPGERIYRTGDMARFRADGRIVVLGRMDGQVKLRGHRIELGEIETVLAAHGAIAQCVALLREDRPGDQRLVLYAVAAGTDRPEVGVLRGFAGSRLPDYMLPSAVVWLDTLPLTPNGKVDRRALPAPAPVKAAEVAATEPLSPAERLFGDIFADVLGVNGVGRYDNFFDLGGHSLLAMRVVDRFRKASGMRMQPGELFQQTVGQLAAHYGPLMQQAEAVPRERASPGLGGAVRSLLRKVVAK